MTAFNARPVELHLVKRILVNEIEAAASVHYYFSHPKSIDNEVEDQCVWSMTDTRAWLVLLVEGDGSIWPWLCGRHLIYLAELSKSLFSFYCLR